MLNVSPHYIQSFKDFVEHNLSTCNKQLKEVASFIGLEITSKVSEDLEWNLSRRLILSEISKNELKKKSRDIEMSLHKVKKELSKVLYF